jgi:hypothetical protein
MTSEALLEEQKWCRLREFAQKRANEVIKRTTDLPLAEGPSVLVQFLPLQCFSFAPSRLIDLPLRVEDQRHVWPLGERGHNPGFIAEGAIADVPSSVEGFSASYSLVRFDGSCESAAGLSRYRNNRVSAYRIADDAIKRARAFGKLLTSLDIRPPVAVQLALIGVKGIELESSGNAMCDGKILTEEHITAPLIVLESAEDFDDPDLALRPIMDFLWRAGGVGRCFAYDENKWIEP